MAEKPGQEEQSQGGGATTVAKLKECPICGEERGDVSPCPHCGMT